MPLLLRHIAPVAFVILWSTGWIAARYVADFADPLLFLVYRFALAGVLLGGIAALLGASWPKSRAGRWHAVASGVLLHAGYLGGVLWAVKQGLPASLSALIAALQPILSAILAPFLLRETFSRQRALGVLLGFGGLCLILAPRLAASAGSGEAPAGVPILVNMLALVSATAGTFYQKRFVQEGDLRTVATLQYAGATAAMIPAALLLGNLHCHWSPFAGAVLAWSVLALSIGAIMLLLVLIREGEVGRASQLLFLAPPVAAVQAMILFGDRLSPIQWIGMAVTTAGVALAMRRA
jgi:drug/metabolite transporter (DMT)-like permease